MTRGDQRDRDRAKNLLKQQQKAKSQGKSGNPLERNASDAAALAAKVAKKEAMKKQQEENEAKALKNNNQTVVRKKVPKKAEVGLDDLLNAGLKKK